jgi:hypothetical protein
LRFTTASLFYDAFTGNDMRLENREMMLSESGMKLGTRELNLSKSGRRPSTERKKVNC